MRLDRSKLENFLTHSDNIVKASKNLDHIKEHETFSSGVEFTSTEIDKLHESLFYFETGTYDSTGSRNMDYAIYEPLALDIADFLNDNIIKSKEELETTNDLINRFIGLFKALNQLIRIRNDIKDDGSRERDVLEKSFSQLTEALGNLMEPLGNEIKDVFENAILEGPSLHSLRNKINSSFAGNDKTLRSLLHLDKNTDGSTRKNRFTSLEKANQAKRERAKKQKAQNKKIRKARKKK